MPKTVWARLHFGKWHDIEVEDDVTAYFEYDNGATGVFITTTGELPGTNRFEVSGTRGKLVCENGQLYFHQNGVDSQEYSATTSAAFSNITPTVTTVETDGENPQHVGIINNFTNAILGKEPLFVAGTDGLAGVELMNAIQYSGWLGSARVSLPVDEDAYLAELDKRRATSRLKSGKERIADTTGTF